MSFAMPLTKELFKELQQALISAFPDEARLERMLKLQLGKNLAAISTADNLLEIVFRLIETAEAENWVLELVGGARAANPGNTALQAVEANLSKAIEEQKISKQSEPVPEISLTAGGTEELDSPFYIKRKSDFLIEDVFTNIHQPIVIEGSFQVGKSSLLLRMIEQAKQQGKQVVNLNLQFDFDQAEFDNATGFYKSFFRKITRSLSLLDRTKDENLWAPEDGNNSNGNDYMADYILKETTPPILIAIDEANRLFSTDFATDFFSMLRGWHDKRHEAIWKKLSQILVIATSADPFIKNHTVSPFNVAQPIQLQDFNFEQLQELNGKYSNPLKESSLAELHKLLSGHPYLTRQAFFWLGTKQGDVEQLLAKATEINGPFKLHLNHCLQLLEVHSELKDSLRQLLANEKPKIKDNYALYRAGFVKYVSKGFEIRNELYRRFLEDYLSAIGKPKTEDGKQGNSVAQENKPVQENESVRHIVLLIHGIRSQGDWQGRVKYKLEASGAVEVRPVRYGYFKIFEFLSPFLTRSRPMNRVKKQFEIIKEKYPDAEVSVIAQSFGSYIIGNLLKKDADIKIKRLILFGSVLPREYEWADVSKQVGEIVNECGKQDIWPVLAKATSWGYGASGTHGFGHVLVKDRFHKARHGDYIEEEGFVEGYWQKFIEQGKFIPSGYDTTTYKTPWRFSILEGFPIQWIAIGFLVGLLFLGGYFLLKPKGKASEDVALLNGGCCSQCFIALNSPLEKGIVEQRGS